LVIKKDFRLLSCSLSRIGEEQIEVRDHMRARQSLHEAAYSYATMSGLTQEMRLKTEIRSRSIPFPGSAAG
jgi:hypothetical protein